MARSKTWASLETELAPGKLEEILGQDRAVGIARSCIELGRAPNFLFYGPSGCGKTSLAKLLAKETGEPFDHISAAVSSIKEVKGSSLPLLVIDDFNRFSKDRQEAFSPLLDSGELCLIATMNENPSGKISAGVLSRLRVVKMEPLRKDALLSIAQKGLERLKINPEEKLLDFLCGFSGGDARALLKAMELLPAAAKDGHALIPERLARILPQRVADANDRDESARTSALIKSIRKGAVQAAVYWLAALLESGADPMYVCRRLVISAAEDIGLANPNALVLAQACMNAVEKVGRPEGDIIMSETAIYLALSPKSRSACNAVFSAKGHIAEGGILPVPEFLRHAHDGRNHMKYPISEYLPYGEGGFYVPEARGREEKIVEAWKKTNGELT